MEKLENLSIKDKNLVSLDKISLDVPFVSLFSQEREININIHKPQLVLDDNLLKKGPGKMELKFPFQVNRINIIGGELNFAGKDMVVQLLDFNLSSFTRSGKTMYRLRSPHLKAIVPIGNSSITIEGDMIAEFRTRRTSWKLSRFLWNTAYFRVEMNGRVFKTGGLALSATVKGSVEKLLRPLVDDFQPIGYLEGYAKIRRKENEILYIESNAGYRFFTFRGEVFDNLTGTLNWNSREKVFRIQGKFNDNDLESRVNINARPGFTRVNMENIAADRISRIADFDDVFPVEGIARKGNINIRRGVLDGTVTIVQPEKMAPEPGPVSPPSTTTISSADHKPPAAPKLTARKKAAVSKIPKFRISGDIDYWYDSHVVSVKFSTRGAQAEFGTVEELDGEFHKYRRTSLLLKGKAKIDKVAPMHKYTKWFMDVELDPWKLAKGTGSFNIDLKRVNGKFFIETDMALRNFTSAGQPIDQLTGRISTKNSLSNGIFRVKDRQATGWAKMFVGEDYYTVDFNDVAGESEKFIKVLELQSQLSGHMTGKFHLIKKDTDLYPHITGEFYGKRVNFYDYFFDDVRGELDYQGYTRLNNLTYKFYGGRGHLDYFVDWEKEIYSLDGAVKGIDVSQAHPEFKGLVNGDYKGKGAFDEDPIVFNVNSGPLWFYENREFTIDGSGKVFTDFSDFRIESGGNILNPTSKSPLQFKLQRVGEDYTGSYQCTLTDINLLVPWGNNMGTVALKGQIFGIRDVEINTEGHAEFNGRRLALPNFSHTLENFSGDILFSNFDLRLRSLQGTLGGGKVNSSGYMRIEGNALKEVFLSFVGKKMDLYIDRVNMVLDTDLNIKLNDKKLFITGNIHALSGLWKREMDEGVSLITDSSLSPSSSKVMNMMEFDLKLSSTENIRAETSIGKATGKFNLRLTGTPDFPILTGIVDCREGEIDFSGKKFDLVKARLVFNNKFMIDPLVNIESESFIKNYRIKFTIKGTSSRLKPELKSSPPLPARDILSLISLGELFERPTSAELSSQVGTGTAGLIASGITEEIRKRTKKIFGNYMLQFDPRITNISGDSYEMSSRLIVGKEISKDFIVVLATNFATQSQQVLYLQYQLSPYVSLIGMRDEKGRLSLDLRYRKRH